ncbi:hypothetical protein AMAG_19666 [Allomyces macrogynus ATCC 38327]|uniref:Uncharacterized protein n=1 Tax=Allomyces macrogynus (strain ATCC 38327) TaxID=578462 RepID=A0A0L0SXR9_ALLM3|nr:hypothetical protein AMAG_19666 [Allomyces macrogynus ATCC 38327]|eukprot:KNE67195.1 hypothetical protein AMAG_19666 [Allomyces macrogynus ATCC 38327]
MNPNIPHQHRCGGPAPRLDRLPYDVLDHIAEYLCRKPATGRACVSAMHLALVVPTTFAPCLHVVIRKLDPLPHVLRCDLRGYGGFHPKTEDVGLMIAVNYDGRAQMLLVLPLRDEHRLPAATVRDAQGRVRFAMPVSSKWSLLNVPLSQVRTKVSIVHGERISIVPPRCQRLSIRGSLGGSWSSVSIPSTLHELGLDSGSLSTTLIGARNNLVDQFPPHLRTLSIINAFQTSDPNRDTILTLLFEHATSTLTSITLRNDHAEVLPDRARVALAMLLQRLPSLSQLELQPCENVHGLDTVMAALPRSGLRKLALGLNLTNGSNDIDEDAWARFAASFPTTVRSLTMRFLGRRHDPPIVKARLLVLVPCLPLATHQLVLSTCSSRWDCDVSAVFPLAPTLRCFALSTSQMVKGKHLAPLLQRLPSSVTSIRAPHTPLGGTAAIMALVRHLPPTLVALDLTQCGLLLADLNKFILYGPGWPETMRELSLRDNGHRPINSISCEMPTMEVLCDTKLAPWVAKLPPSLRFLDVYRMAVSNGMAAGIVTRMVARHAVWRRLTMVVRAGYLTDEALTNLQSKVHVQVD